VLTKFDAKSDSLIKSGAQTLLLTGVKSILLTLGANGSVYYDIDNFIKVPTYKIKVVDTTAAGDTYIGSFIASRINKKNILESMKFATAAASLAITKKGAQISIPSYEEVISFLKEKGEYL
jgi:ribokinase